MTVTRTRSSTVPWTRFVDGDCACDQSAPCLLHFDGLDWKARATAFARAGVKPSIGR